MFGLSIKAVLLILVSSLLNAQVQLFSKNVLSPISYNHIGNEFWASGGAGIAERGLAASAFSNPAGNSLGSFCATVEGIWKPETPAWLSNIRHDNLAVLPSYVSVGVPIGNFAMEVGYCSPYGEKHGYDIPITTEAQTDGTGQSTRFSSTSRIHTGFVSISWEAIDKLSLGITMGIDFAGQEESFASISAEGSGARLRIIGGMQYHFSNKFGVGLVVNIPSSGHLSVDYRGAGLWVAASDSNMQRGLTYYKVEATTITYDVKSPLIVDAGASLHIFRKVEILASAEYQNWSEVYEWDKDLWQFHVGLSATLLPQIAVRIGYFTDRYPDMDVREYYDQSFLTAGITFHLNEKLSLTFSGLTSKPFTEQHPYVMYFPADESFHQSALSAGISVSF